MFRVLGMLMLYLEICSRSIYKVSIHQDNYFQKKSYIFIYYLADELTVSSFFTEGCTGYY